MFCEHIHEVICCIVAVQMQCIEDEYMLENELFTLDYRIIDGDVTLPDNMFRTEQFRPHGS